MSPSSSSTTAPDWAPEYNFYHEGLQQPFEIAPGVEIARWLTIKYTRQLGTGG